MVLLLSILFSGLLLVLGKILGFCSFLPLKKDLNSRNIKIASALMIFVNARILLSNLRSAINFSLDTSSNLEATLRSLFSQISSLSIVLLGIGFGVFLLCNQFELATISSALIVGFTLFNNIFLTNVSLIGSYFSFLSVAAWFSLIIVLLAIIEKTTIFHRYTKWFKAAPYLILLGIINNVFSLIKNPHFNLAVIVSFASIILKFLAFWFMFNALESFVPKKSTDSFEVKLTKKEKTLTALSVLIFPTIIYLVSSVDKTWLFVGAVVLAIFLPFALMLASSKKSKIIATIITLAIVVALGFVAKIMPKNNEEFDPNKCYWCEGMGFYLVEEGGDLKMCSHCHGTGKRN